MNIGLKLWSINTDFYFEAAKQLYSDGWFKYIELYVVPDTLNTIEKWKTINIPFTLHAPHFDNGVNLALKENEKINMEIYDQVKEFNEALHPEYIVAHSGIEGSIEETIRQLKLLNLNNILIENKPHQAPTDPDFRCRGAKIDEIQKVIDEVGCGFCLDVGHSLCTAVSFNLDPYQYLKKFNNLSPRCYHLSDNQIETDIDNHLHLGNGNYNFKKIFSIIDVSKNIAIETCKDSKKNLDDFIKDVEFIMHL